MSILKRSLAPLIVSLGFVVSAQQANACSCLAQSTQDHITQTSTIFSAKVSSILEQSSENGFPELVVSFDVLEWWKDGANTTVQLTTSLDGASCGYHFEPGQEYLVYSHNGSTGVCTGTKLLENASWDLTLLGADTLKAGWNLISYSGNRPMSVEDFLTEERFGLDTLPFVSLWYWNAGSESWAIHHKDMDIETLQTLDPSLEALTNVSPSKGYWINMEVESKFNQP